MIWNLMWQKIKLIYEQCIISSSTTPSVTQYFVRRIYLHFVSPEERKVPRVSVIELKFIGVFLTQNVLRLVPSVTFFASL